MAVQKLLPLTVSHNSTAALEKPNTMTCPVLCFCYAARVAVTCPCCGRPALHARQPGAYRLGQALAPGSNLKVCDVRHREGKR